MNRLVGFAWGWHLTWGLDRCCGSFGIPPGLHSNSSVELFDPIEDLLRIWMQPSPPPRALAVEAPHPDVRSKVDKNRVEGDLTIHIPSGTECGQAGAGGTPFVQEPIFVTVKQCEKSGGGVFDQHGMAAGQEVSRMKNDKFAFPVDVLGGTGEHHALRQQRKSTLTSNQSIFLLRPGSIPCVFMWVVRSLLSSPRRVSIR